MRKNIKILYYAQLRDQRGADDEKVVIDVDNVSDLFDQLKSQHNFSLSQEQLRVAVNDEYVQWDYHLCDNDKVIFIPPVSGG